MGMEKGWPVTDAENNGRTVRTNARTSAYTQNRPPSLRQITGKKGKRHTRNNELTEYVIKARKCCSDRIPNGGDKKVPLTTFFSFPVVSEGTK